MKTLILYGTKAGTTEDCANTIAKKIKGGATVLNIKKIGKLRLDDYSCVIVGTPIYAGMINGKIKKYLANNEKDLNDKILGVYTCGFSKPEEALNSLSTGISENLKSRTKVIMHLGGELRPEKLGFFMRFIIKKMSEGKDTNFKLDTVKINEFCNAMNKQIGGKK
jgi:menaquinone-dependent protoporphyrinogen oxidase